MTEKKLYTAPDMDISVFQSYDVIATSGGQGDGGDGGTTLPEIPFW